ncbi:MAG TPA: hypothetical protein VGS58_14645 [Candidatus Sulfopaludibacter sp.]|nr:hypothetical protein [Candidatus Sulfopaludibacter sp.]
MGIANGGSSPRRGNSGRAGAATGAFGAQDTRRGGSAGVSSSAAGTSSVLSNGGGEKNDPTTGWIGPRGFTARPAKRCK